MKRRFNKNKGFTLIELLVVIVILGVLSAVSIAILKPAVFYGKGRNTKRETDLQAVRSALEQYYLDHGRQYPSSTDAPTYSDLSTVLADYISEWPTDPINDSTYYYSYSVHEINSIPKCYQLSATLENNEGTYTTCGGSLTCQADAGYCDN